MLIIFIKTEYPFYLIQVKAFVIVQCVVVGGWMIPSQMLFQESVKTPLSR